MDFGVVFPTTQIGTDPAVIRDFAQTAEGLGYRRLLVYDHVLGAVHADRDPPLPGPYTENDPFHEPRVDPVRPDHEHRRPLPRRA
jgi:alkanesulfonate monooxygenase SsuD/methylene tetrahydromethanopterin reductase-like flavin-dependent oxidoreductase (luciferase family)